MRITRRGAVLTGVVVGAILLAGVAGAALAGGASSSGSAAPALGDSAATAPVPEAARSAAAPAQAVDQYVSTERSLVRTAQLSVEVEDPVAGTRKVRTVVAGIGGSVAQDESGDGSSRPTLRVPAEALDRLVDDFGALGHVTARSGQVVDLNARVASQQASVVRVRTLLGQARSIGDIVSIESELSRREADLDSLTDGLAALRDQVALSTLTVDITKASPPPVEGAGASGFPGGLGNGWDGLRALASGAGALAGFVLPFLPVLALLGGLGWLGRRAVRLVSARLPAKDG